MSWLDRHLWSLTDAADLGLGWLPLVCSTFTVIYGEFAPCVRTFLRCARALAPDFHLHLNIKPSSMCFLLVGGKVEHHEETHTNSKQIGSSFPHRDYIQDLRAAGDSGNRGQPPWRRSDLQFCSLANEMFFTCQSLITPSFIIIVYPGFLEVLPEESPRSVCL